MTWRDWLGRSNRDREIDDEIESHLRLAAQDRIKAGESPEAARRAAEQEFGDIGAVKAVTRSVWGWTPRRRRSRNAGRRGPWTHVGLGAITTVLIVLAIGGHAAFRPMVHALVLRSAAELDAAKLTVVALAITSLLMLVLVIVCANLTNRVLLRRRSEALRRVLSASRARTPLLPAPAGPGGRTC